MEIIIYTDNMQVSMQADIFNRYPTGVTVRGMHTHKQMEKYPEAKLATAGQDLYDTDMLVRKIQVFNPDKFKEELEAAHSHPHGLNVALGFNQHDYDFLLWYYSGKSVKCLGKKGRVPGMFWTGWKEQGITEEEYLKKEGAE